MASVHDQGLQRWGAAEFPRGNALLHNALLNKGTAFTEEERDALGVRGLLPPHVLTLDEQVTRSMANLRRQNSDLDKYIFLTLLQNRNETLFFKLLLDYLEELMPIIYTPTVGQACLEYHSIFRQTRGIWIGLRDRGHMAEVLRNWPLRDVRVIVVTDGERILGLGDLGALGMGISVGKLSLYTACAGLHPSYTLPITLDVGTNNQKLLTDPLYIGSRTRRVQGAEYDAFIAEFMAAVGEVFPKALVQFEDFGNANAFRVLEDYRHRVACFNDDIQGTAAVALAGLLAATRLTGRPMEEQTLLFYGAGEAGTGIGELVVAELVSRGVPEDDARRRCWFIDSKGLLVKGRGDTPAHHKLPFTHEGVPTGDMLEAIARLRPTGLVGVAGTGRAFTQPVIEAMAQINERPIIFALSNPTSKAECTADEAYRWSQGRAIFASGSPFPPVELEGRRHEPGQGNNVYIFPGVGLGAVATGTREVTSCMFLEAARELAGRVTEDDLRVGRIYPSLRQIREVAIAIAVAVARRAHDLGLARQPRPADLESDIRQRMFVPEYLPYV